MLAENLLYGQMPKQLSSMPSLQVLSVFRRNKSGPRLSGTLPSLDKLPQLTDIYLQGNSIGGEIPRDFLSASRSISTIKLGSNLFTGEVPFDLATVSDLTMELEDNLIEGFPSLFCEKTAWMDGAIGKYGCNAFLCPPGTANPYGRATGGADDDFDYNSEIDFGVIDIKKDVPCFNCTQAGVATRYGSTSCQSTPTQREILVNLYYALDGDKWTRSDFWGTTADVCDWYGIGCISGQVTIINLRGNNLQGMPGRDLFYLRELQTLWLYSNPITFSFDNIGSASRLQDLRLDSTRLRSLRGIGAATSLISFDARFTDIRGTLPQEILSLTNLRSLSLGNNLLTGTLPKSFGNLRRLVSLSLDSNRFNGGLPAFDDMHFLKHIDLSDNSLAGPISKKFLNLLSVSTTPNVMLHQNLLTGVVPEELARFTNMNLLVADNKFLGLPISLCFNPLWNEDDIDKYGCDGIMCRPGTYNKFGRYRDNAPCEACPTATYYGEIECFQPTSGSVTFPASSASTTVAKTTTTTTATYVFTTVSWWCSLSLVVGYFL